jgi:hypothetical protein
MPETLPGRAYMLTVRCTAWDTVTSLFPHFVEAQQSAKRGLNVGWYAMDQDGEIVTGPYRGRNECAISIAQSPDGAPALWSRP